MQLCTHATPSADPVPRPIAGLQPYHTERRGAVGPLALLQLQQAHAPRTAVRGTRVASQGALPLAPGG